MTKLKSLPPKEEVLKLVEDGTYKDRAVANLLVDIFVTES